MDKVILKLQGIGKSFASVRVLSDISMEIKEGHVVTLMGENGAGKSTLCKIIAGNYHADSGTMEIDGQAFNDISIDKAREMGIRMVHQELLVLPKMTIMENIFVGNETSSHGFLDSREMREQTKALLDMVGLDFAPETRVSSLDIAARQLVEIARALRGNAKIIILDEPTSSLSDTEIRKLFDIVNNLKRQGVTFIFISHRMQEILEISDEVFVLKDGELVAELLADQTSEDEIVRLMVGRNYDDYYHRKRTCFGEEVLRVEHMSGIDSGGIRSAYTPEDISFSLHQGEILGLSGLVGAGRTELVRLIFGEDPQKKGGKLMVFGKEAHIRNSKEAMDLGMVWLTEDRKNEGLILKFSIRHNIALPNLKALCRHGLIRKGREKDMCQRFMKALNVKATGPDQNTMFLSGGNQQKVILAKWLAREPKIIIMDEPTRGIDVGAKAEIYKLMNELTAKGTAILLISSELPEIMGMSDRILVMHEGKVTGRIDREEFSEERIMVAAVGR